MTNKKYFWWIATLTAGIYFFSWFAVDALKVNRLDIQSEDTIPAVFLPLSIIKDKSLYLDKYYSMMLARYPNPDDKDHVLGPMPFYLREAGGHYLSAFPIISAVLALPVYFPAILLDVSVTWQSLALLAHISGALIMGFGTGFFYILISKFFNLPAKTTLLTTLVYGFATINYSLVSQGLWQHGTVQLFTTISLIYFMQYFQFKKLTNLIYFGFFMGFAVLSRPTALLVFAALGVYIIFSEQLTLKEATRKSAYILFGLIFPVMFFLWYNAKFYLNIQNQGYSNQLTRNWLGNFPFSFFGVWLSPSKGILVYSPVFIFSLIGARLALKKRPTNYIFLAFTFIVLAHTLVISFWKHWFGGWSYGYRMSSDILPFLVLLLVPWLQSEIKGKALKVFIAVLVVSVMVQISGIVFFDGVWHAAYDKGFKNTAWLWSIKDSEAAFNMRRVLVKAGLLDKACEVCAMKAAPF